MNSKDFNDILEGQIFTCREILVRKAGEYATDTDRIYNFKVAAALEGCTVRRALAGMMVKHTVSIFDLCRISEDTSLDVWDEKITDHLNYLFLLKAVIHEEFLEKNDLKEELPLEYAPKHSKGSQI